MDMDGKEEFIPLYTAFLHPDLGIGGAEKAVVDFCLGLRGKGHSVVLYTSHHDPEHCFEPTKDGTLCVEVAGDWIPRTIKGKFHALFANLRMIWLTLFFLWDRRFDVDVVFVDQVSIGLPILSLFGYKTLFYCHYPDLLLAKKDGSRLKSGYRAFFDWLEAFTTGFADKILVNSNFTKQVFQDTFPKLSDKPLSVLYPVPDMSDCHVSDPGRIYDNKYDSNIFISINRYEEKKGIDLMLQALHLLKKELPPNKKIHLIIAGGHDARVQENIDVKKKLESLCSELVLCDDQSDVIFLTNISSTQKRNLLASAKALVYTPQNEHFGIVPIESMHFGTPVIACNSGGPRETVLNGKTGILAEPTPDAFKDAMLRFYTMSQTEYARVSSQCQEHVDANFSFRATSHSLEESLAQLACHDNL